MMVKYKNINTYSKTSDSFMGIGEEPIMLFIGVTTSKSFVKEVFSSWIKIIGVEANLVGVDLRLNSSRDDYRNVISNIKTKSNILGALVTSHKANIYDNSLDYFDTVSPSSNYLKEVGVIYKVDKKLACDATDPDAQTKVLRKIIPARHWEETGGYALIMGAGGAGLALVYTLVNQDDKPVKIIITEVNAKRVVQVSKILKDHIATGQVEVEKVSGQSDKILSNIPPSSLIVNASGLGKDLPGSPISNNAEIPLNSIIWEFNYRGDLEFLKIAQRQRDCKNLIIENGWNYFIFGWGYVMSKVFKFPPSDNIFAKFLSIANDLQTNKI